MTYSHRIAPLFVFVTGLLTGIALHQFIPAAQAQAVDWAKAAEQPEFRAAVIEVINGCIVDNGIIFCN